MQQSKTKIPAKINVLGFLAMTISMVVSLYEYPTFATSGFSLVFFLLLGGLLWFIPVALCAAEMATVKGWEKAVSILGQSHIGKTIRFCRNLFPMV